jgi:DNA-binding transcriptional LysR family regulator
MDTFTFDQITVFLAVVDEGSFPKAAKSLQRAQSAVTYAIRKLEAEIGVPLFDRSAYRSVLTPAGRALLIRARRIAEEAGAFREQARGLASGLEPELCIVLDALYPMPQIFDALRAFTEQFPTVPPRLHVASLGAAANLVTDGTCSIGLLPSNIAELTTLHLTPLITIHFRAVVSPFHPLASIEGIIEPHVLRQHVQLVLTDASTLTAPKDWGVLSSRTWRLADLGAKKSMLLAGLGWGNMPAHMVEDEIKDGRLTVIQPAGFDSLTPLVLGAAYISEHSLGPAGRWMLNYLTSLASVSSVARVVSKGSK